MAGPPRSRLVPDTEGKAVSEFRTTEYAESIFATAREAFVLLDDELRVRAANRAFYETFRVTPAETEGRVLCEIGAGEWDVPALRRVLEEVIPRDGQVRDFEVRHDVPRLGRRNMLLNARRVTRAEGPGGRIFLAIEDVTEKYQAREEARRLREELEDRVRQRTAELEAFSYSVSHDLRSPLRALDGFARILMEEHAADLPAEGQEYVRDIRRNARKMGQLVDDLLAFSALGRQAVQRRRIAPAALVGEILEELRAEQVSRRIEVVVADLPTCHADPALLRQVWANLLGNAFKYTRRHDPARVEVGCVERDGERVYFVRDNGAGFDMRYAGKLFGVFQRLHTAAEYDGTGVGLAIVQRIVHGHGGRVWAEAAVNQGATFHFTLPDPAEARA
jgi:PAS domain S-box-containing protein